MTNRSERYTLDDVLQSFYLQDNRIIKVGSNINRIRADKDITEQYSARLQPTEDGRGEKLRLHLIRYVLENQAMPIGSLIEDDDGKYIDITNDRMLIILNYRGRDKVRETQWSTQGHRNRFIARWIDREGNRSSRTFDTTDEAIAYQNEKVEFYFGDELRDLNLHRTYFTQ